MKYIKLTFLNLLCFLVLFSVACGKPATAEYKLNKTEITLSTNGYYQLELSKDDIIIVDGINWKSQNPSVASVNGGLVTAKSLGQCNIIASYNGVDTICLVTVSADNNFAIKEQNVTVETGREFKLNFTNNGSVVNDSLKWETENADVATVNNGVVTGVSEGQSIISVKYRNKTYTTKVTVIKAFITEGHLVAEKKVIAMGKTFIFDLTLNKDGSFVYKNREKEENIAEGTFTYNNRVLYLSYADKQIILDVIDENTVNSRGKIETGGMKSELTFTRVNI